MDKPGTRHKLVSLRVLRKELSEAIRTCDTLNDALWNAKEYVRALRHQIAIQEKRSKPK